MTSLLLLILGVFIGIVCMCDWPASRTVSSATAESWLSFAPICGCVMLLGSAVS